MERHNVPLGDAPETLLDHYDEQVAVAAVHNVVCVDGLQKTYRQSGLDCDIDVLRSAIGVLQNRDFPPEGEWLVTERAHVVRGDAPKNTPIPDIHE